MKYKVINENDCQYIVDNNVLISYAGNRSNIIIPDCIKIIGKKAFKGNLDIRSLALNKVVEVGEDAFSGCKNLKHVILSDSLSLIEQCAFSNIENSAIVIYRGTVEDYNKILKGEPFTKVICDNGIYSQTNFDILM